MLNIHNNKKVSSKACDYEIALAGNPNVGKSTIFNALTGLKQHTGNWSGKTVSNATGYFKHNNTNIKVVDLPGVYSLSANSQEEQVANDYINRCNYDCIIIVVDSTNLLRNLNLVIQILNKTNKVILCLNMSDEADSKGIYIDEDELSLQLGIPVVKTSGVKKAGISELKNAVLGLCTSKIKTFKVSHISNISNKDNYEEYSLDVYDICSDVYNKTVKVNTSKATNRDRKLDKIVLSKLTGIPIMLVTLAVIFWITIVAANSISEILSNGFNVLKTYLIDLFQYFNVSDKITSLFIDGIYTTLAWVVAVMFPPMAIFFPLFSLLEDSGFLPRIAFNLDGAFSKCGGHGKQALTMAMGFGCNSCGVMGCRIIESERERSIATITNNFIPCNGRLPALITITSVFIAVSSSVFYNTVITAFVLLLIIILSVAITLLTSKFLSKTIYKGQSSSFILELPPYRKPQVIKTIVYSLKDRALFVLLRAVAVAIPSGAIIWIMANITVNDISLLSYCTNALDPIGYIFGLDGTIIMAFILGLAANETVIPIILMSYLSTSSLTDFTNLTQLSTLLVDNGWTVVTAICFLLLCVYHFPCSTTLITIYKETKSIKSTLLSFIIPTVIGLLLCLLINLSFMAFQTFF
ncbi:MAG: ferrous iron transporter B [Eubacteriales bacterium]|nr:ferrous iron transporter B [Eubacteriales bacterium]